MGSNGNEILIESKVEFIEPPKGSNVAREIISSFRYKNSSKILVVDGTDIDGSGREFSGEQLWLMTGRLATGLMKSPLNLQVGDRVLLMSRNNLREKLLFLATLYTGASVMGNAPCGYDFVRNHCEPARPRVILTSNEQLETALRLRREVDGMAEAKIVLIDQVGARELIQANEAEDNLLLGQDLFEWPEIDEELIRQRVEQEIEPSKHHSMLMMTTGSTSGRSKVVPWTHERQLADIWSISSATRKGLDGKPAMLPLDHDNLVVAGNFTLIASSGTVFMLWCLINGGKFVLIKSAGPEQYWRDVAKFKLTIAIVSSDFAYTLLKQLTLWLDNAEESPHYDISSMRYLTCSGQRINLEQPLKRAQAHYEHLEVTQYYGATEIGYISMLSCQDARQSFDCVGHLFPGVCAKIVDINTKETLGPNQEGELHVKSPSLFDTYVPYPGGNLDDLMRDRKDEQGFYRTGDLVYYDEDERFYIRGRINDTLNLDFGWKIMPSEIEGFINKHPLVEASVVVGMPHAELEGLVIPKAFVKLKTIDEATNSLLNLPSQDTSRVAQLIEQMKSGCHEQIIEDIYNFSKIDTAKEKELTGGIRIVPDFPKIGSFQKVDRRKLMQLP